jgi:two-component system chemotaxis response regulator CheY
VLVVDDEVDSVEVLAWLLQDAGCDVRTATGVEQALSAGREFHPTLLITDYLLCDAGTGLDVIRELRQDDPELRAILVTGMELGHLGAELGALGNVNILRKPLAWAELQGQLTL